MAKIYVVELNSAERKELQAIVSKGRHAAAKIRNAQILLHADQSEEGPAWKDEQIAEAFDISVRTVERTRQRCVEEGLEEALVRRPVPQGSRTRKLDGKGEAWLCKLACSKPPKGREHWSIRLLADQMVELQIIESISRETVRKTLKKTKLSLG